MSDRINWLESKHLEDSVEGAAALQRLALMPAADRETLIGQGDRFAAHSVSLAHRYLVAAVRVYGDSGRRSAADWERAANTLLRPDGSGREAAASFFSLEPSAYDAIPEPAKDAWLECAAGLIDYSRRLGSRFVGVTGPVLCDSRDITPIQVEAWRSTVVETLDNAQWRGEFVAAALIDSAQQLMPYLEPASVTSWAGLLQRVAAGTRSPKLPDVPSEFESFDAQTVCRIVDVTNRVTDPQTAAAVLPQLSHAIEILPSSAADDLLSVLDKAAASPALGETLSLIPGVIHGMAEGDIVHAYSLLPRIGDSAPDAIIPYLRTIDRALEEGGRDGVDLWVSRGLEIANTNPKAGVAHFRLESRTSHKILTQHSAAVAFEEVEGLMQRFLTMMSRKSFQLSSGPGIWFRPPLAAPEDTSIHFPERVDLCDTVEDNQLFYKLTAAHIAGRWEYGTYDIKLDRLIEAGYVPESDIREANDVMGFIDSFPNPLLAASLFVLLDGARIDAALTREFKGLAGDLARLGRFYAENPPPAAPDRPAERLLEALFMMSVGKRTVAQLDPRLRRLGRALEPAIETLSKPEATAYDSAKMLAQYYATLALAQARPSEEYDVENMIAQISGATVIDPLEHLDGDGAPMGGDAGTTAEDSRADIEGDLSDQDMKLALDEEGGGHDEGGVPLTPEELRALIESGIDLKITSKRGNEEQALGLYITDLLGKLPAAVVEELREHLASGDSAGVRAWLTDRQPGKVYVYDEWDHTIRDYRRRWCRLTEHDIGGDSGEYFNKALSNRGELLNSLKREFQLMKPEQYRKVKGMDHGEEVDLAAAVDAHADRRSRQPTTDRLYVARQREERDIATLFLLDMSASTDEPLSEEHQVDDVPRRVIDVTKDTIAIMSQVIEEIGDAYAVYGFSGHGRDNVEYFHVKSFNERLSAKVKARLGGIEPRRSTRMGAALRHSAQKLARVSARSKYMILLSDGFPQDFDYGDDRRSNLYGNQDTMTALREMEDQAIRTFCITVDPAGHDYLREMCPESRYAVIDDISTLPEELPRIYRMITRG